MLAFSVVALTLSARAAEAAVVVPSGFEVRTVATGLSLPTAITWAPDGRMFVAQKKGTVLVVNQNGTTQQLLDISSHVYAVADRGLLGIAADADFATNHWLYLLYVYNPSPEPSGLARTSRLTRVTVNDDNTVSDGETVILGSVSAPPCPPPSNTSDCIPSDGDSHSIGTVRSASDGTIWLGNGDASDWTKVDPMALRTYDEQSLAGKIMHIDRNGDGLSGHPFCPGDTDLTHVCTKLYAKGLRNPFRFVLRPGNGPAVGDVGWETYEELDLMTAPGRNYGWPCYEGLFHTSGYKDLSGCASEYAKEGGPLADTLPDLTWVHDQAANFQGAVVAGPTYPSGGSYPSDYAGDVFFADYTQGYIKRLKLDSSGNVTSAVPFATGAVPVDLELGPGNQLYYVDFGYATPGTGSVKRIVYTPGNSTPVPQADASPTYGPLPLTVSFSGAGSNDPDGDPLTYDWDFGDSAHSSQRDPTHVFSTAGEYDVKLTVTDNNGASATTTVRVSAGNTPPTATIDSPADGSQFQLGEEIQLHGSAADPEDGQLTGTSLQWQVSMIHLSHVHDLTGLTGAQTSFTAGTDHDANSHYRVTLVATDSAGRRSDTKVVNIYPRAINLTLGSSPPGAQVTYGGSTSEAPRTQASAIGFVASMSAAQIFTSVGTTYEFAGWSDGVLDRARDFTIPSTDTTLTALYTPQVLTVPGGPSRPAVPSPPVRSTVTKACYEARTRLNRLRQRITKAEREARLAKRHLDAAGADAQLRNRYRDKQGQLRRLRAQLKQAVRNAGARCAPTRR
jgi:glucose/arabinose dehydrogenase